MAGQHILGPTSHYFYSQRLKLHYVDWGNPDKPLLVLIHGMGEHMEFDAVLAMNYADQICMVD